MPVGEKSDLSKTTSDPPLPSTEWDESSLAKLVGLDDGDDTPKTSDEYSLSESLGATPTSTPDGDTDITQGNVLEDDELFDDPHSSATPKTVAKSPFAKLGLVGSGLGAVFLVAGLLLQGIMSPKGELKAKNPTPTPTPTVEAQKQQNTEGQLKTQLALNSQSDELKQLDEAKKNQKKQKVSPTDPKGQKTPDGKTTSPTPTTAATPTTTSASGSRTYSSPPPQARVSSPPARPVPAAAPASSPLAQVARSTPSSPTPTASQTPTTPKPSSSPTTVATFPATPKVDVMTQWQTLVSLGSYSAPNSDDGGVMDETNNGVVMGTPRNTMQTTQQGRQLPPARTPSMSPAASPQATPTESNEQAEQRLLNGTPYRVAASGSMANGVMTTPVIVPTDSKEAPARAVITLTTDLTDTSGQIVMPVGTALVFEVRGIDGNGVMNAVAVSQLDNTGMERALPSDALVLTGEKGSPLIAKGYFNNGGTIASLDVSTAILGALGKFGEILNRPREQTSSSITGGTVSQTTTSTTGEPNLFGALLEGGANPVLEQIMKRNERAIQDMQQRKNLWFVEAGTRVQILVNRSFEL